MKKFFIYVIIAVFLIGCGGLLDDTVQGRTNPNDPQNPDSQPVAGQPEINIQIGGTTVASGGSHSFDDTEANQTDDVVITIQNLSSDTALSLTNRSLSGGDSNQFSLGAFTGTSVAAGSSVTLTVSFAPTTVGAKTAALTITSDDSNEGTYIINLSGTALAATVSPLPGTAMADGDFSSGATILVDSHIPVHAVSDDAIDVGGDIVISDGATFVIAEGVTLDMNGNQIEVETGGILEIRGTDAARVMLTGSSWGGILINGEASIVGAYIEDLATSSAYGIRHNGGDLTLRHSRIHHEGTTEAIQIRTPDEDAAINISNNIIAYIGSSSNSEALALASGGSTGIEVNISYNTIIGKSYSGMGINITDSTVNLYDIDHNIFYSRSTDTYFDAVYSYAAPVINATNNIIQTRTSVSDDLIENVDTDTDNLEFSIDTGSVFVSYDLNDFRMALSIDYPNLSQAGDIANLVGALSTGANQIGAYGNGGYPPNYNE